MNGTWGGEASAAVDRKGVGPTSGTDGHDDHSDPPRHTIRLSLTLPRDRLSVPIIRHLAVHALTEVGVVADQRNDVELAISEACGNVVDHSGPGDAYEVNFKIGPQLCEITVVDVGRGFDSAGLKAAMAPRSAERGRGIALMHALMDTVRFEARPEKGTIVHLVKTLRFDESAPARRLLLDGGADGEATDSGAE